MHWRFKALGATVNVASDLEALSTRLDALLSGYADVGVNESLAHDYVLRAAGSRFELVVDGTSTYRSERLDDVLDAFQIDLYKRIVGQVKGRWLLHAAALAKGKAVVVLAGPSDAGKSTLCRALMKDGWVYLSEEIVSLGNGSFDALRRPLHLDAPEQVAELPLPHAPVSMRQDPPSWLACLPGQHIDNGALEVRAIVRIQYQPDEPTRLVALSPAVALEQLWACRMNTGLDVAHIACAVVGRTACYRLDVHDSISALAEINTLVSE